MLYNIFMYLAQVLLPVIALFDKKISKFYKGRKHLFLRLSKEILPADRVFWMHCASLGEFEQGRPLLDRLKRTYPNKKLVLSFFSPSGYEVRKDYHGVDLVVYMPLDTPKNARKFINIVKPELAIFVKYEFWPNFLKELKSSNIPSILISGIFRKNQHFFRKYNKRSVKMLQTFSHFFVQNDDSKKLLKEIGFTNVSISGDTRFDRVQDVVFQRQKLAFIKEFTQNAYTLVAGSTWPKDETLLVNYINEKAQDKEKFIIVPHEIDEQKIQGLQNSIKKTSIRWTKIKGVSPNDFQVLIIDAIGILTSVYAYADVAYVGGGFGMGIHNVLEPATYSIPILIGPNYQKFQEALDLVEMHACFEVNDQKTLNQHLIRLLKESTYRKEAGIKAGNYVQKHIGASDEIMAYIKDILKV